MPREVTFWFEFASTYSYLSAMRVEGLAHATGVTVRWKPFLLGPIFQAQGWTSSPFNIYPAKGRYMWRDMARICQDRGLPFLPEPGDNFPQNGLKAARVALAALETEGGMAFSKNLYLAQFGEGLDIANEATIGRALRDAGLPEDMIQAADDPARKAQLRANTEEAQRLGLFGAPSFTVGEELFWGDDRLGQALDYAQR